MTFRKLVDESKLVEKEGESIEADILINLAQDETIGLCINCSGKNL